MYYIYSLIVAFIVFVILQQMDKNPKNKITDDFFNNIFTFVILYIICTFVVFLLYNSFTDGMSKYTKGGGGGGDGGISLFDMNIVQNIPDTEKINTGFGLL